MAPPHGYEDEFELFVAARGPADRVFDTLAADAEINGIKFKKGRKVAYRHDLNRIADDLDRRTFVLEPTLRAVEARMVRLTSVEVETGRDAPQPVGAPVAVPKVLEAYAHRFLALSDRQSQDHHRVRRLTACARACPRQCANTAGTISRIIFDRNRPEVARSTRNRGLSTP